MHILLFLQIFISCLLVMVILLQQSSSDGLSGMAGGSFSNISYKSVSSFLTKTTIILSIAFMANSLLLANMSSKQKTSIIDKIKETNEKQENEPLLPVEEHNQK